MECYFNVFTFAHHSHLDPIIVGVHSTPMPAPPSVEIVQVLQPSIDIVSGDSLPTVLASCE